MSETKHTHGPWIAVWREDLGKFRIGPDNGDMPVAGTVNQGDREHEEANARLIAAAPDLLVALKEIHKLWCCPEPKRLKDWSARCDIMADYARKAISKAEGRQS